LEVKENWTLAIGQSILPVKGVGGAKIEDTVRIAADGGKSLTHVTA